MHLNLTFLDPIIAYLLKRVHMINLALDGSTLKQSTRSRNNPKQMAPRNEVDKCGRILSLGVYNALPIDVVW